MDFKFRCDAYKTAASAAIHEAMADLHEAGGIDADTMREFDASCLIPIMSVVPLPPYPSRGARNNRSPRRSLRVPQA
jgi:hypothetical protein